MRETNQLRKWSKENRGHGKSRSNARFWRWLLDDKPRKKVKVVKGAK
jgi:hypothetical protein